MVDSHPFLVLNQFGDNRGELVEGTYIVITKDTVRAKRALIEILRKIPRNKVAAGSLGRSMIDCGKLKIFFFSQYAVQKALGIECIKGYAIERGVENSKPISDMLNSRIRG